MRPFLPIRSLAAASVVLALAAVGACGGEGGGRAAARDTAPAATVADSAPRTAVGAAERLLDPIADSLVGGHARYLPCTAIDSARQVALTYRQFRPVESCAFRVEDTVTVLLRTADSAVVSIVRVWPTPAGMSGQEAAYQRMVRRLGGAWGASVPCPDNDRRGAAGDRLWTRPGAHVRLFKRGPGELVVNYELGPGSCTVGS